MLLPLIVQTGQVAMYYQQRRVCSDGVRHSIMCIIMQWAVPCLLIIPAIGTYVVSQPWDVRISHTWFSAINSCVSPEVNLACVMLAESCIHVQDSSIRRPELVNKRVACQGTTRSCNLQRSQILTQKRAGLHTSIGIFSFMC